MDDIIGIVSRYTLVTKQGEDQFDTKMREILKPIHTVTEKKSVSDVLEELSEGHYIMEFGVGVTSLKAATNCGRAVISILKAIKVPIAPPIIIAAPIST